MENLSRQQAGAAPGPAAQAPTSPAAVRSRDRGRRWLILLAVCLVLGAAAWFAWYALTWQQKSVPPDVPRDVNDPAVVEAIRSARQKVLDKPDASAWGSLAMVFHAHDCAPEALKCYAQAEQLDASDRRWPYYHAMLLKGEDPAAAIRLLRRAAAIAGKDSVEIRLALADLLLEPIQRGEAEDCYQQVLHEQPDNLSAHLGLGKLACDRRNWKGSLQFLIRATEGPETKKRAYRLLAVVYMHLGQEKAAAEAELLASRQGSDVRRFDPLRDRIDKLREGKQAGLAKSDLLYKGGAYQDYLAHVQELASRYPNDPMIEAAIIRGLLATQDYEPAKRAIETALKKWPRMHRIHFYLGQILYTEAGQKSSGPGNQEAARQGYRAAAKCFEEVTRLKPDDAQAYFNLGLCYKRVSDRRRAGEALRMSLALRPNYVEAHAALGDLLIRQGEDAEALVHVRYAIALGESDDLGPYQLLARVLARGLLWG